MYLSEVAEYLLAQGHSNALTYTMRQAVSMYFLANKRQRGELLARLGLMRVANHADKKEFTKVSDSLS